MSKHTLVSVALKLRRSANWNGEHKPKDRKIHSDLPKDKYLKWILNDKEYLETYKDWEANDYSPNLKPSLDRLDNDKGYVLGNLQILTWEENHLKQVKGSRRKVIANLPNGKQIEYPGVRVAKRAMSYNIQPYLISGKRDKHDILWTYEGIE